MFIVRANTHGKRLRRIHWGRAVRRAGQFMFKQAMVVRPIGVNPSSKAVSASTQKCDSQVSCLGGMTVFAMVLRLCRDLRMMRVHRPASSASMAAISSPRRRC